jgi:hypothetical protein
VYSAVSDGVVLGRKKRPIVNKQAAPVAAAAPTKVSNGAITIEQIKAVAQTVKVLGDTEQLNALLGLVKEVGGLKKFKDLVDALTV